MSDPVSAESDAPVHTPGWPCGGRITCPACAAAESPGSTESDALVAVIKAERERHKNLGPRQSVFNVRCACGHVGQQVSVNGEFEQHVDEAVAGAISALALPLGGSDA